MRAAAAAFFTVEAAIGCGGSGPPEAKNYIVEKTNERTAMPAAYSERFARALQMAYELHARDARKGKGTSAMGHLLSVAGIVIEYGGSEDEAIAALLHDAIEDAGGLATEKRIREAFGETVASIVRGCTDTDQTPKPPWEPRKQAYLEHLASAGAAARFVSCADKLANVRSMVADLQTTGEQFWKRFNGPKHRQLWLYGAYAEEFLREPSPAMAAELSVQVKRLSRLAEEVST